LSTQKGKLRKNEKTLIVCCFKFRLIDLQFITVEVNQNVLWTKEQTKQKIKYNKKF
jgi:hypothetical protein